MQLDERVGILPVTPGCLAAIDEGDVDFGMVDQRVGECHPHGSGANDQVVGGQRAHDHA